MPDLKDYPELFPTPYSQYKEQQDSYINYKRGKQYSYDFDSALDGVGENLRSEVVKERNKDPEYYKKLGVGLNGVSDYDRKQANSITDYLEGLKGNGFPSYSLYYKSQFEPFSDNWYANINNNLSDNIDLEHNARANYKKSYGEHLDRLANDALTQYNIYRNLRPLVSSPKGVFTKYGDQYDRLFAPFDQYSTSYVGLDSARSGYRNFRDVVDTYHTREKEGTLQPGEKEKFMSWLQTQQKDNEVRQKERESKGIGFFDPDSWKLLLYGSAFQGLGAVTPLFSTITSMAGHAPGKYLAKLDNAISNSEYTGKASEQGSLYADMPLLPFLHQLYDNGNSVTDLAFFGYDPSTGQPTTESTGVNAIINPTDNYFRTVEGDDYNYQPIYLDVPLDEIDRRVSTHNLMHWFADFLSDFPLYPHFDKGATKLISKISPKAASFSIAGASANAARNNRFYKKLFHHAGPTGGYRMPFNSKAEIKGTGNAATVRIPEGIVERRGGKLVNGSEYRYLSDSEIAAANREKVANFIDKQATTVEQQIKEAQKPYQEVIDKYIDDKLGVTAENRARAFVGRPPLTPKEAAALRDKTYASLTREQIDALLEGFPEDARKASEAIETSIRAGNANLPAALPPSTPPKTHPYQMSQLANTPMPPAGDNKTALEYLVVPEEYDSTSIGQKILDKLSVLDEAPFDKLQTAAHLAALHYGSSAVSSGLSSAFQSGEDKSKETAETVESIRSIVPNYTEGEGSPYLSPDEAFPVLVDFSQHGYDPSYLAQSNLPRNEVEAAFNYVSKGEGSSSKFLNRLLQPYSKLSKTGALPFPENLNPVEVYREYCNFVASISKEPLPYPEVGTNISQASAYAQYLKDNCASSILDSPYFYDIYKSIGEDFKPVNIKRASVLAPAESVYNPSVTDDPVHEYYSRVGVPPLRSDEIDRSVLTNSAVNQDTINQYRIPNLPVIRYFFGDAPSIITDDPTDQMVRDMRQEREYDRSKPIPAALKHPLYQ